MPRPAAIASVPRPRRNRDLATFNAEETGPSRRLHDLPIVCTRSRAVLAGDRVSRLPLRKGNRGHVASIADTHIFGRGLLNEARLGFFSLRNTRRLDDDIAALTSDQFGISNPALLFDSSTATRRLGHFVDRGITWSFGGPNDSFNRREQQTRHASSVLSGTRGRRNLQAGGDFMLHNVETNLPEE